MGKGGNSGGGGGGLKKIKYFIKLQNISINITSVFYFKVELRLEGDFGAFNV